MSEIKSFYEWAKETSYFLNKNKGHHTDTEKRTAESLLGVDCKTCENRGKADGLSQETHCDHCIYQERWRTDHYAPKLK